MPPCSPRLDARGVRRTFVTLHVGAGTFQPVREDLSSGTCCTRNTCEVSAAACAAIKAARAAGGRMVAVGTTVVRSLETAALAGAEPARCVQPYRGTTRIFIKPGFRFRVVDAMLTNFHLPESTLVMLCARLRRQGAAAGRLCACGAGEISIFQLR